MTTCVYLKIQSLNYKRHIFFTWAQLYFDKLGPYTFYGGFFVFFFPRWNKSSYSFSRFYCNLFIRAKRHQGWRKDAYNRTIVHRNHKTSAKFSPTLTHAHISSCMFCAQTHVMEKKHCNGTALRKVEHDLSTKRVIRTRPLKLHALISSCLTPAHNAKINIVIV